MVSDREIERQFRLVRQTVAIHAMLRDGHSRRALAVDGVLLAASVVFCATTFAGDEVYEFFGLDGSTARIILGIAAIAAFFCSIVLLRVNWKGLEARHGDAVTKWSETLRMFREGRQDDGSWPQEQREELNAAYWNTDRMTITIPDKRFNGCKTRYLLKCEISALASVYPGCPRAVLWAIARWRGSWHAVRDAPDAGHEASPHEDRVDAGLDRRNDKRVS